MLPTPWRGDKQRQKRQFKDAAKKLQKNMNRTMRRQPSLGPAIVISDSEDEDDPMNATVIPVSVAAPSLPPTPPADTTTCSDPGICGPSLFYESRLPNNGKDKQPVYADAPSAGMLNMHGMSFTLPSQNDSIGDRPASTPVDEPKPSAFDYSLISDTSLQVTATADTLNCSGDLDFITLDDTLVAGSGEEPTIPRTLVPRGEPGKKVDASLEDGEIIDVETEDSLDDSVVFVSEGVLTPKNKSRMQSKKVSMEQILKKKAEFYREQKNEKRKTQQQRQESAPERKRRMVIIDGSNVAFSHLENGRFSVLGLELCLKHFLAMGFDAKAVVPQFRMKRTQTDNHVKMLELEQRKLLIKTPAKDLAGKFAASYDDRFILNIAKEFDAAVVSNDHYRDLLPESPDYAFVISNRVIGYTWVLDKLFIPDDPYGKIGPNLNQILFVDEV